MRFQLENIATGERMESPVRPTHHMGVWDCGTFRMTDAGMTEFRVIEVPEVLSRHITVLGFRNRFSLVEKIALEIAVLDDPTAAMAARHQAASLRTFMKDVETASFIDLGSEHTRQGVLYLESGGLLAEGRAAEILDAEIQAIERYEV